MSQISLEQRSKNMRAIRASGSKIEVALAKELWNSGIRYRKNDKSVFGKPDLTIKKHKLAIFVDGEFWHGKDWDVRKKNIKSNTDFWYPKIEKNILRDIEVNKTLSNDGWVVLRFWETEILKNIQDCSNSVIKALNDIKSKKEEIFRSR